MLLAHMQIEVHPRYPQTSLRRLCADNNVAVVAYSSLGVGDLVQHPVVLQIAQDVQHTPAQARLQQRSAYVAQLVLFCTLSERHTLLWWTAYVNCYA